VALADLSDRVAPSQPAGVRLLSGVLAVLLGLTAIYFLFFHRLADRDLWSSHEARAGMDAQSILDEGRWGLPGLYDGRSELQKPPLYYWMVALVARLRGGVVDAWAVRLPSALAALAGVLAVAAGLAGVCRRPLAGLLAAVVLATAVHFTWLARIGRIDMPLTLSVTLAVGASYLARRTLGSARRALLVLAYLAVAAGVLLKGPIGFVLPVTVMSVHLVCECGLPWRERGHVCRRALHELGVWWGFPLIALVCLPWFVWANAQTNGEFAHVFLWHHNIERGWGGSSLRSNPWWFYFAQFQSDFLPWSLLLPLACWWIFRRSRWREDAGARFGLIWFASVLCLLSCALFKRADYLLPAYPGAAVFLGCVGERWLQTLAPKRRWIAAGCAAALAALMVVGWVVRVEWKLPGDEPYRDYRRFAECVRRLAPRPEEVIFFRTEAHPLAFHVGRPLAIVVQWGELSARLSRPGTHYIVTPPQYAEECRYSLRDVCLERVLSNTELSAGDHERPLVLLRADRFSEAGPR
jgi:4-amino-4-deoxy-L-arabinose transferase-like glycosyltransferase